MKIMITGGLGFIGSAVVRNAIKQGHIIINYDAMTYASCCDNVSPVANSENYFFERGDIRDKRALHQVFQKYQPEAVMHLAAESHVDRSIDNSATFIQTNIVGTFNVLETARHYWLKNEKPSNFRFHHISTDEVFGSLGADGLFTEYSRYDPSSPYSASKASSDHLVRAWAETYGLPTVITNCSNNYGPYHFPEKLIPVVIINALENRTIPIYGAGENIRDWLYVEDHAEALLTVLLKGKLGRSYNIGGGNQLTNINLARMICSILDKMRPSSKPYSNLIKLVADRPGHDKRYAVDSSRIQNELGWYPSVTIEVGLKKTVQWYLDNEAWWRALMDREGVGIRLGTAT